MRNFNGKFIYLIVSLVVLALGITGLISTNDRVQAKEVIQNSPALVPFTAGNLVIYRVGTGADSLVNTGNAVFLDEYTPSGTLVQSIALPTAASGANQPVVASGTATSEGNLTRSVDGRYLIATGYGTTVGGGTSLPTTTVARTVARIDASGTIDSSTALTDFASANNPRGAVSTNGTDIWVTGGAGGTRYATLGSTTSTQLSTDVVNIRAVNIVGGQLYVSTSSGAFRLATIGTGTPTTSGQTTTNLPGIPTTGISPYQFFFADLSASVAGVDTVYLTDDTSATGGIIKYSLVGGTWVQNGVIDAGSNSYRGLTASVSGTTVTLYATRRGGSGATGGGELVSVVDATGYNVAPTATPNLLATAAANTAFRGVAFTPSSGTSTRLAPIDFNGDGRTDYNVIRTQSGASIWYNLINGTNTGSTTQWGATGDTPVPADYDGDRRTDFAVWRSGVFYILQSQTNTVRVEQFGQTGDNPTVVADFNGDGRADLAVYRPGTQGFFYYRTVANGAVTFLPWGTTGDKPVVGDYDGDGTADVAVIRSQTGAPSSTIIRRSTGGAEFVNWGDATQPVVPGDYDGDGRTDICTTGMLSGSRVFYILTRTGTAQAIVFGLPTDTIVPGDYDGDGRTDLAVWRNGVFYVRQSSNSATTVFNWGASGDTPAASFDVF